MTGTQTIRETKKIQTKTAQMRIEMLGPFRVVLPDGTRIARFRTEKTAAALACLALAAQSVARETLIARFWADDDEDAAETRTEAEEKRRGKAARQSLRMALSSLRATLGAASLLANGAGAVTLTPGAFVTDAAAFETALKAAGRAQTLEERERKLEEAIALVRGSFLEGFAPTPDRWIETQRQRFKTLYVGALLDLGKLLENRGDDRNAFDAALQAVGADPESAAAREAALHLSARTGQASVSAFDDEATLEEMTARLDGHAPVRSEARRLQQTLETTLSEFAPATRTTFARLCVFPQSFTAQQAMDIAGASERLVALLVERHLLIEESAGERRLSVARPLRPLGWETLSNAEQARTRERMVRAFLSALRRSSEGAEIQAFAAEGHNLQEALRWLLQCPEDAAFAPTMNALWKPVATESGALDVWLRGQDWGAVFSRLPRHISDKTFCQAWAILAHYSLQTQQYETARRTMPEAFARTQKLPESEQPSFLWELTQLSHHGQEDALFTEIAAYAVGVGSRLKNPLFLGNVHWIRAENHAAQRNPAAALSESEAAVFLLRRAQSPLRLAHALRQRGSVLFQFRHIPEAVSAWEEALALFHAENHWHGMGECLEDMARLRAASGGLMEATFHIRRAIELFERDGDRAAVLCAGGVLADILLKRGETEEAHRLIEEGLAFWRKVGHSRWIRNFEERASRLQPP